MKKITFILVAFVVMSCSSDSSREAEPVNNQNALYVGTWQMVSRNGTTVAPNGHYAKNKMQFSADDSAYITVADYNWGGNGVGMPVLWSFACKFQSSPGELIIFSPTEPNKMIGKYHVTILNNLTLEVTKYWQIYIINGVETPSEIPESMRYLETYGRQ